MQKEFANLTYEDRPYTPKLYTKEEITSLYKECTDILLDVWCQYSNANMPSENTMIEKVKDINNRCTHAFVDIRTEYNVGAYDLESKKPDSKYYEVEKAYEFSRLAMHILTYSHGFNRGMIARPLVNPSTT
jgi:hypothetical protein